MATRKPKESDVGLPFTALQLLAPPVRLVSAALWKVVKQRDVMQYGVVEEFVTSACEAVPGLLTMRHQGRLALGLRVRLILELCCKQPDVKVLEPHLSRIRAPASSSSASTVKKDVKIIRAVESFQSLVHTLLTNPAEREQYFKEEFHLNYGPVFDQELEKLLWEFLIRLDQLLPVPNLAQTASWLINVPPVLEECARASTQPQLLKILLQHQTCLGHLDPAASLPPNMGESILDSLSLPLSGRLPSNQPTEPEMPAVEESECAPIIECTPFITPVIGLICNKDVPVMISASKRVASSQYPTNKQTEPEENLKFTAVKEKRDETGKEDEEQLQEKNASKRSRGNLMSSESDEEQRLLGMTRSGKRRIIRQSQVRSKQSGNNSEEEELSTRAVATCMTKLGVKTLHLPEEASLCSIFVSCLSNQPRVVVEKLPAASVRAHRNGGKAPPEEQQCERRRRSPVKSAALKTPTHQHQKLDSDLPGLDDKENRPILPSISSSPYRQRSNTEMVAPPGDGDDYVADSEDEATKNFKGRLFMKRYYRTKHGTYVPTLREFWKPGVTRRDVLSAGSKRR